MTHDDMMEAIKIYEQNNCDKDKKISEVIVVKSFKIANTLVTEYGFFNYLVAIYKDKLDPDQKRRVWIFNRRPEVEETFNILVNEARQARINKE